jgi:hypothetical protein
VTLKAYCQYLFYKPLSSPANAADLSSLFARHSTTTRALVILTAYSAVRLKGWLLSMWGKFRDLAEVVRHNDSAFHGKEG